METKEKTQVEAVKLPKCKFAGDNIETCEYCDYNIDEKENLFSYKVLCGIDGKWHNASYVCRYYK